MSMCIFRYKPKRIIEFNLGKETAYFSAITRHLVLGFLFISLQRYIYIVAHPRPSIELIVLIPLTRKYLTPPH